MLLSLVTLEVIGRQTTTDLHDALLASFLGLFVTMIYYRHRTQPLPWVTRFVGVVKRVYAWLWQWTFEFGFDLRGEPRIKRGYPPGVAFVGLFLLLWSIALLLIGGDLPSWARSLGVRFFYVGYLAGMAFLWIFLILGILLSFLLPIAMIHDQFVHAWEGPGRRPRQMEFYAILGYLFALFISGWFLPIWLLLALCVVSIAVNVLTMALPANTNVQFLWRPRGSTKVRAIPWTHWIGCELALITLLIFNLVVTSCGERIFLPPVDGRAVMPITGMLGMLLAWLSPGLLAALVFQSVMGRWRDPARRCLPLAHVRGVVTSDARARIGKIFAVQGWKVRFDPEPAASHAVQLVLVGSDQSEAREFDPVWPLKVSEADLADPEVFNRLARRSVIQSRRKIVSGLKALFKRAAERRFRRGHGFWVAPHYWFIAGLSRDQHEEELDMADNAILSSSIGPAYYRVLPRLARHHLYDVLRALQIDLIFVEDGVSYRRFTRVLRRIFEIYDKSAGQKRAEDTHFVGLPGTRVIIHEFQLDDPFRSKTYPEPKYDHLGRARILHIFRDRTEEEELIEPPFDFSRTPSPIAMG